jgi:hypothetical protein
MRNDELAVMRADALPIERYARQPLPPPRDIVAVLFRQRLPMLAAFALVMIAVAFSGVWIPKYQAQMKILALRQCSDAMVTPSANAPDQFSNDQVSEEDLNSEVELLNSDVWLRRPQLLCPHIIKAERSSDESLCQSGSCKSLQEVRSRFGLGQEAGSGCGSTAPGIGIEFTATEEERAT